MKRVRIRSFHRLLPLFGLPALLACSGTLDGAAAGSSGGQANGFAGNAASMGGSANINPGTGGTPAMQPTTNPNAVTLLTTPPSDPTAAEIACTEQAVVPEGRIWRLSASAYKNSIASGLGSNSVDLAAAPLDAVAEGTRFAASSEGNVVNQEWGDWFFAQGEQVAAQLAAALPPDHACMTAAAATPQCVQGFIDNYATRLFRRPLTPDEVTRYQTAYTQAVAVMGPLEATQALLQAWTMSPNHLFRTELGNRALGEVELTQHEIASQISFLFANTAPDAALLADAAQNRLADPVVVRAHAERLLQGPGGREVLQNFFTEFLHLREIEGSALAPEQRPLVPSMQAETASFVENVVFNQQGGLDTLLTATSSYIDQPLAQFYGVPAGAAAGSAVDIGRSGLLHQAAFLNARRDATRRGLFVRGELLCSPPSPPPPDAVEVASQLVFDENDTARDILQEINDSGAICASCHASFSPLGLSFEHYDSLGAYREQQNGQQLDVTGTFPPLGDLSAPFTDSVDMVNQVVASNQGQLCFSKRFISYLQGRKAHGVLDGCLITRARTQMVSNNFSLQSFMLELTQDPSFYRRINLADQ